jgi:catechol 2,3-dioxygenase-like lactoylglutathione lyase family enzyme
MAAIRRRAGTAPVLFVALPLLLALPHVRPDPERARSPSCPRPDAGVWIDHVVVAVDDLDVASSTFHDLGFTIREGILHPNGLRTGYIKFEDGSYLELMDVEGEPRDSLAAGYATFLDRGEGGAFLALRADPASVVDAATAAGLGARLSPGRAFDIVTVPAPALGAVFFLRYDRRSEDSPADVTHANGATGIAVALVEGGEDLVSVLVALGARRCEEGLGPTDPPATTLESGGGRIAVTASAGDRPRVLAVRLHRDPSSHDGPSLPREPVHGVRLGFAETGR